MQEVWTRERETWMDPEATFVAELNKAIELGESAPAAPGEPALLLPALPASVAAAGVAPTTLPQLFLRPDAIVFVDSLASLQVARAHLLSPQCKIIGVDLEHLPENLDGLDIKPTLCHQLRDEGVSVRPPSTAPTEYMCSGCNLIACICCYVLVCCSRRRRIIVHAPLPSPASF
jgi:hypothetical protein